MIGRTTFHDTLVVKHDRADAEKSAHVLQQLEADIEPQALAQTGDGNVIGDVEPHVDGSERDTHESIVVVENAHERIVAETDDEHFEQNDADLLETRPNKRPLELTGVARLDELVQRRLHVLVAVEAHRELEQSLRGRVLNGRVEA